MIYNQNFCFCRLPGEIKQPRASVVSCKANARSKRRDICLRIIAIFSLQKEESSFYKQLTDELTAVTVNPNKFL